ncbi:peptidoglycan-binding domain-containing protein [Acaryochloris sp. IP29b_bin.137]|uniref:peptidoglycan-binding domain-containing protein n=1 Tax=Acaryochloris sp. IP29b_bin.137 TaxID=2969217 RepID=UPI00262DB77E|nr:peptidoglycan-binding domain-containing protein [Acaryochloris sp. IP29b_bin.137]
MYTKKEQLLQEAALTNSDGALLQTSSFDRNGHSVIGKARQWARASSIPFLSPQTESDPRPLGSGDLSPAEKSHSIVVNPQGPQGESLETIAQRHAQEWGAMNEGQAIDGKYFSSFHKEDHPLQETLTRAQTNTQAHLDTFLQDPEWRAKLATAIGQHWDSHEAEDLLQTIAAGQEIPEIEIVTDGLLEGNAAYGSEKIFISDTFLYNHRHNLEVVSEVLLEELGHHIDGQLKIADSPGDEGEIFARIAQGENLSRDEIQRLKAENDYSQLTLGGITFSVENSALTAEEMIRETKKPEEIVDLLATASPYASEKINQQLKNADQIATASPSAAQAMYDDVKELSASKYPNPIEHKTSEILSYHQSTDVLSGKKVAKWQHQLEDLGYDIDVDGYFGSKTDAVTRQFQQDHGLKIDGIVGPETWDAINKAIIQRISFDSVETVPQDFNNWPVNISDPEGFFSSNIPSKDERPFTDKVGDNNERIPLERQEYLIDFRDDLIKKHAQNHIDGVYELTHFDVADLIDELASRHDLSDNEKAFIWTKFAFDKQQAGVFGTTSIKGKQGQYEITPVGVDPVLVNDDINTSKNTSNHTIVGFTDGYHGPLVDLPLNEAKRIIIDKESRFGLPVLQPLLVGNGYLNEADINSSYRTVQAMQVYDRTGSFSRFAEEWKHLILHNGEDGRYEYSSPSYPQQSGHIPAPASPDQYVPERSAFDENPYVNNSGVPLRSH